MKRRHTWKTVIGLCVLTLSVAVLLPARAQQKSDAEVKVAVEAAKPDADGKLTITIDLHINKGWHIYSNPVGNEDLASAQTVVKVDGKNKPASVKISYPKGKTKMDKLVGDYVIYEGKVSIQAVVERAAGDTGPLEVSVRFQACNDKGSCLFPATVRKSVP
jgi:DsbC/DsbD-like thiol-disulfide interchange protein